MKTSVRFLGTDTVVPEANCDTACLLVNNDCLIDTGWNAAINMQQYGNSPLDLQLLLITHCHHDHYIGLPQILFFRAMRGGGPLTIIGPRPDIHTVVERACLFLREDHFRNLIPPPNVINLQAGQDYEDEFYKITTAPTVHPVVGLCYRILDKQSGKTLVATGDTAYRPPLAVHAEGADLLVHEASCGAGTGNPLGIGGHSGAIDAANIAKAAGVKQLAISHYPHARTDEILHSAREIFPATVAAKDGDLIEL